MRIWRHPVRCAWRRKCVPCVLCMHAALPSSRYSIWLLTVTVTVTVTGCVCGLGLRAPWLQTPRPPPKPVAAFLSPILWAMEQPDRFDMYSVGKVMLQLTFPHLVNDDRLCAFNKRLAELKFDLAAWRKWVQM